MQRGASNAEIFQETQGTFDTETCDKVYHGITPFNNDPEERAQRQRLHQLLADSENHIVLRSDSSARALQCWALKEMANYPKLTTCAGVKR